jgi:hypothetical protein
MALVPNFTVSQLAATPNVLTVYDISSGSDNLVTKRRVYLLQSNGTYLVPTGTSTSYVEWPVGTSSINLNVFTQDTALTVTVQWLNVDNTILYTKTNTFGFTAYSETFYYGLTQDQVGNPNLSASTNWYQNKMILRVEIDSGNQAISFASDIVSAQSSYNRAMFIVNNSSFFF